MRQVTIGISAWGGALVHLKDVDRLPGHIVARSKLAKHQPRRMAAAERDVESAASGNRAAGLGRNLLGGVLRHGSFIIKYFDLHVASFAAMIGLCHAPKPAVIRSDSRGPQVPGSY